MLCAKGGGERGVVADACVRTYLRTYLPNIRTFSLFPCYSPLYPPISIKIYSSIIPAPSLLSPSLIFSFLIFHPSLPSHSLPFLPLLFLLFHLLCAYALFVDFSIFVIAEMSTWKTRKYSYLYYSNTFQSLLKTRVSCKFKNGNSFFPFLSFSMDDDCYVPRKVPKNIPRNVPKNVLDLWRWVRTVLIRTLSRPL